MHFGCSSGSSFMQTSWDASLLDQKDSRGLTADTMRASPAPQQSTKSGTAGLQNSHIRKGTRTSWSIEAAEAHCSIHLPVVLNLCRNRAKGLLTPGPDTSDREEHGETFSAAYQGPNPSWPNITLTPVHLQVQQVHRPFHLYTPPSLLSTRWKTQQDAVSSASDW